MDKAEIEAFADDAPVDQLRKFVLVIAQILSNTQIKAVEPHFVNKVAFCYNPEESGLKPLKLCLNAASAKNTTKKRGRPKKKPEIEPEPEPEPEKEESEEEVEEPESEESDDSEPDEQEYEKEEDPEKKPEKEPEPETEEELDYEDYLTDPSNSPVTPEQAEKEFNEVANRQPAS